MSDHGPWLAARMKAGCVWVRFQVRTEWMSVEDTRGRTETDTDTGTETETEAVQW